MISNYLLTRVREFQEHNHLNLHKIFIVPPPGYEERVMTAEKRHLKQSVILHGIIR